MTRWRLAGQDRRIAAVLVTAVRAVLDDSLAPTLAQAARAVPQPRLVDAADYHRIAPLLREVFRKAGDDDPRWAVLEDRRGYALARHLLSLHELGWVTGVLDEARIGFVVLKGPVLVELAYRRPDLRPYTDIDVLVDPQDFGRAVEALELAGAGLLDRNWPLAASQERGQLSLLLPQGTPLDLHWHLVNEARTRATMSLDPVALLDRRVVEPGPRRPPRLDDVDMLHHLALHAGLSGGRLLQWFADMALWRAAREVELGELRRRARDAGTRLLLECMLDRMQRVTGASIEGEVGSSDHHLGESADGSAVSAGDRLWRGLLAATDRVLPVGRPADASLSWATLVGAIRGDAASTLRAAGASAWQDAVVGAWHRRSGALAAPNPLHQAAGSERDRREYFDLVIRRGRRQR